MDSIGLEKQDGRSLMRKASVWLWDKILIIAALCVLFVAVIFSAVEVSMGWVARKLFDLTERIK